MTHIDAMRAGVQSPYANVPEVRRLTRLAGFAAVALGIALVACAVGLVASGLVNTEYLIAVSVVALLPGITGVSLLMASRRILRGEIYGAIKAMTTLVATVGLVLLGTVGALIEGPWPAKVLMVVLTVGTVTTMTLVNRADRALKGQ
ncbi:hypothetical protein ABZ319_18635 [Nocardia sp. NPDC005978]|uniref:hypothetical protein n=1 Tax=Nocardia sp. NPDC005978 TaxID=3156725 RepID=UPI0033AE8D33